VRSRSTWFWGITRDVDSRRQLQKVSSAVSATSRLKAPLTEPSARPTALGAPGTGKFTALGADAAAAGVAVPVRPVRLPLLGNARAVVFPSAGSTRPPKPHWTPSARA